MKLIILFDWSVSFFFGYSVHETDQVPGNHSHGGQWIDAKGELTNDAIADGYDLDTQYLFYNCRDNGQSDRWGGAVGFIAGDKEGRCAQWPPEGYGDAHLHTTNE